MSDRQAADVALAAGWTPGRVVAALGFGDPGYLRWLAENSPERYLRFVQQARGKAKERQRVERSARRVAAIQVETRRLVTVRTYRRCLSAAPRVRRGVRRQRPCGRRRHRPTATRAGPDPGDPDPAGISTPHAGRDTAGEWNANAVRAAARVIAASVGPARFTFADLHGPLDLFVPAVPGPVRAAIFNALPAVHRAAAWDALAAEASEERKAKPRLIGEVVDDFLGQLADRAELGPEQEAA
jgi:hypothetical protein